ncbi:MAG TPA: hypothetical protein VES19_16925 [Candidatus Limnocylindrales bacterium]|nr:hypothetical protein [Candidatus Limnocylindrales bacterium]
MEASRWWRLPATRVALFAVAAFLLVACSYLTPSVDPADQGEAVGGPPATAEAIVSAWLRAASEKTGDLGWGLLYPNLRTDLFGSEDRYRGAIEGSDWSSFRYRVLDVGLHDGEYLVRIEIDGTAPAFLSDWGFVQMQSGTVGFVVVRLGVGTEASGIQAVGGAPSSRP